MLHPAILRRRRMGGGPTFNFYAANGVTPALVLDFERGVYLLDGGEIAYSDLIETGSPSFDTVVGAPRLVLTLGTDKVNIPAAKLPTGTAFSFSMVGEVTYADTDIEDFRFYHWYLSSTNYIRSRLTTTGPQTGYVSFTQRETTSGIDTAGADIYALSPGTNVPFSIASRHGATFINGATNGTVETADTTPTVLFDGSATDLELGAWMAGTGTLRIARFIMWNADIGDTGLGEATA